MLDFDAGAGLFVRSRDGRTYRSKLQGLPQFVQLTFASAVKPATISLTFQGGFVGTHCALYAVFGATPDNAWKYLGRIFPEDVNRRQSFPVSLIPKKKDDTAQSDSAGADSTLAPSEGIVQLKIVFQQSSDFFGRITVYDLSLEGVAQ